MTDIEALSALQGLAAAAPRRIAHVAGGNPLIIWQLAPARLFASSYHRKLLSHSSATLLSVSKLANQLRYQERVNIGRGDSSLDNSHAPPHLYLGRSNEIPLNTPASRTIQIPTTVNGFNIQDTFKIIIAWGGTLKQ